MVNLIAVVGPTGTGKSRSISTLNSKETYIINVKKQPLPWRGSDSEYNVELKNTASTSKWNEVLSIIEGISTSRPDIKNIVVDDAGFIMASEYFDRASESGFNKFSEMGKHMYSILNTSKDARNDLNIVFTFHPDTEIDVLGNSTTKIKTIGKLLDKNYTPEAQFTLLLYTHLTFDKDGKASYKFVTNHTQMYPAKSPEGMFDDLYIDNSLEYVITTMNEYYKGSKKN